jgi:hypothetical protein
MDVLNCHLIGKLRDDEEFQNEVQDIYIYIYIYIYIFLLLEGQMNGKDGRLMA